MQVFVFISIFALTSAQWSGRLDSILQELQNRIRQQNVNDDTIDTVHGWRLEDHSIGDDHILLFINDTPQKRTCYAIKVASEWEHLLDDQQNVYRISEEIYALVNDPNHRERPLRPDDLATDYHDFEAAEECRGHDTYSIRYTPSFAE